MDLRMEASCVLGPQDLEIPTHCSHLARIPPTEERKYRHKEGKAGKNQNLTLHVAGFGIKLSKLSWDIWRTVLLWFEILNGNVL